jgi:hypothetical protein
MLSVCDIQGQWREKNTQNVWIVSGIVAERAKRPKALKKPIVLSDGPQGVEWGNGNLKGKFEDGCLVWRNRRGEATYCWKKLDNSSEVLPPLPVTEAPKVRRTPPVASPPPPPAPTKFIAPANTKTEDQSPRSTNSAGTTETAALTGGMGSFAPDASNVDDQPDGIAVAEMKMLVEMAGNRLMAGDVYMGMRYITLAQQVQPLTHPFGGQQQ